MACRSVVFLAKTWDEGVLDNPFVFLQCPLPTASVGSIAARYLEDEEERSQHILECLDAHIEELKEESAKIVRRFEHQE